MKALDPSGKAHAVLNLPGDDAMSWPEEAEITNSPRAPVDVNGSGFVREPGVAGDAKKIAFLHAVPEAILVSVIVEIKDWAITHAHRVTWQFQQRSSVACSSA